MVQSSDVSPKKLKQPESTKVTIEPSLRHKVRWDLQHGDHWDKIEDNLLFGQCIGEGSFARVYDGYDKILK